MFFFFFFFFFNATATTEIYTLSLHDALPICMSTNRWATIGTNCPNGIYCRTYFSNILLRSEEHTSELQSQFHLVCRLLLEKKKKKNKTPSSKINNRTIH